MTHTDTHSPPDENVKGEQLSIFDLNDIADDSDDCVEETDSDTDHNRDADRFIREYTALASADSRTALAGPVRGVLKATADETGEALDADDRSALTSEIIGGTIDREAPANIHGGVLSWAVRPDREQIDDGIDTATQLGVSLLIVDNLATLGDDVRSIRERINRALTSGVRVRVLNHSLDLEPDSEASEQVLNALDGLVSIGPELARETTVDDLRDRGVLVEDWQGRPGLGCEMEDGALIPGNDFDRVVEALELAQARINAESDNVGISQSEAARRLNVSPRTIGRCLEERAEMYGLND